MQEASPSDQYHLISRIIHWLTALIILGLLAVGTYMGQMDVSAQKLQLYNYHKSFGLLVLVLAFIRVVWHLIRKKPKSLPTHKKWEKIISHAVHGFLYLVLFAMPISGWVMSSAGDFNIKFFSLNMPDIVSKDENLFKFSREVHEIMAWTIMVLIALHIAGALKHHFIDQDETLERMTWKRVSVVPIGLLLAFVGIVYGFIVSQEVAEEFDDKPHNYETPAIIEAAAEQKIDTQEKEGVFVEGVSEWFINSEKSALKFKATQYGQTFDGDFSFEGKIFFAPERLEKSKVRIEIDILSIKTGSMDRDAQAKSKDWFDIKTYPKAIFEADKFSVGEKRNTYVAHGTLTLRGVKSPVDLPFNLDIVKDDLDLSHAQMNAEIDLNRLDFGVGQGQWQKTDAISDKVSMYINIVATKK